MYSIPPLILFCFKSNFGWGCTHPPCPEINQVMSGAVYFMAFALAGNLIKHWDVSLCRRPIRIVMILLTSLAMGFIVQLAIASLLLQNSSAHYQWMEHYETIATVMYISEGLLLSAVLLLLARKFLPQTGPAGLWREKNRTPTFIAGTATFLTWILVLVSGWLLESTTKFISWCGLALLIIAAVCSLLDHSGEKHPPFFWLAAVAQAIISERAW